jgi:hypothetical protein
MVKSQQSIAFESTAHMVLTWEQSFQLIPCIYEMLVQFQAMVEKPTPSKLLKQCDGHCFRGMFAAIPTIECAYSNFDKNERNNHVVAFQASVQRLPIAALFQNPSENAADETQVLVLQLLLESLLK